MFFSRNGVSLAISKLKIKKSAGLDKLTVESIKYAHPKLLDKLSMFLTACCKHGVVLSNFWYGQITHVPKNNNTNLGNENYRPITTINVLVKVYEYCLVDKLQKCVNFHEMQFGFTAGGGCDNAVFIMNSVIEYFTQSKSNVFVATLDLTKAYDRVSHCGLLTKL